MQDILQDIRVRTDPSTGIALASHYVNAINSCALDGRCRDMFRSFGSDEAWDKVLKEAESKLVYRVPEMEIEAGTIFAGSETRHFGKKSVKTQKNSILDFECVITAKSLDRDGDILEPSGADIDEAMPLLWQHLPLQPIGRFYGVTDRNNDKVYGGGGIADTQLGHDAAVLVEFKALRISHGFVPTEYTPLRGDKANPQSGKGWHITKFKVLEFSLVSIPSNQEAVITVFSRQKLHHPVVKTWAEKLASARPAVVTSGWDGKAQEVVIRVLVGQDEQKADCSCHTKTLSADNGSGGENLVPPVMCGKPGCRNEAMPGKKLCQEHVGNDSDIIQDEKDASVLLTKAALADQDTPWDAGKAVANLRKWSGVDADKPTSAAWEKYSQGFALVQGDKENFGSYKLPFCNVKDGKLVWVFRGAAAAMAAIHGARGGGMDLTDAEYNSAYATLAKVYKAFKMDAPEKKSLDLEAKCGGPGSGRPGPCPAGGTKPSATPKPPKAPKAPKEVVANEKRYGSAKMPVSPDKAQAAANALISAVNEAGGAVKNGDAFGHFAASVLNVSGKTNDEIAKDKDLNPKAFGKMLNYLAEKGLVEGHVYNEQKDLGKTDRHMSFGPPSESNPSHGMFDAFGIKKGVDNKALTDAITTYLSAHGKKSFDIGGAIMSFIEKCNGDMYPTAAPMYGSPLLQMPVVDGSWEDVQEDLLETAKSYLSGYGIAMGQPVELFATFDDHAILCVYGQDFRFFSLDWEMDDNDEPQWSGQPTEVEIEAQVFEKAKDFFTKRHEWLTKAGRPISKKNETHLMEAKGLAQEVMDHPKTMPDHKSMCGKAIETLDMVLKAVPTADKAGRVLSQANMGMVKEVHDIFLKGIEDTTLHSPGRAMLKQAAYHTGEVLKDADTGAMSGTEDASGIDVAAAKLPVMTPEKAMASLFGFILKGDELPLPLATELREILDQRINDQQLAALFSV